MDYPRQILNKRLSLRDSVHNFFATIAGLGIFTAEFFKQLFVPPYEFSEIRKHLYELGVKSFNIVSITGFIIGLVLAMQTEPAFKIFGAVELLPGTVAIAVVRELGPVITALIFAGRVASGIGAELGSMRVTEQIDAMEVSAINPFNYLVVTRIIATTMILPVLTVYVIFLAMVGSFLAVNLSSGMNYEYYKNAVVSSITYGDLIPGVAKTAIFGFVVGLVGCYKGYTAEGGTEGVGKASTTSVVTSSLLILLVDMLLVKLTIWLWPTV